MHARSFFRFHLPAARTPSATAEHQDRNGNQLRFYYDSNHRMTGGHPDSAGGNHGGIGRGGRIVALWRRCRVQRALNVVSSSTDTTAAGNLVEARDAAMDHPLATYIDGHHLGARDGPDG